MDTKERHIKENEAAAVREAREERNHMTPDQIANSLPANGKNKKRDHTHRTNRLWLWLGVLVLVFILVYWLFTIGMFEDLAGIFNG